MKSIRKTGIFAVILATVLLFTGCVGNKLNAQIPGDGGTIGQTTEDPAGSNVNDANDAGVNGSAEGTAGDSTEGSGDENVSGQDQTADGADTNEKAPVKVKALYLTGWTVGSTKKVEHYVELANTTEINAYVVDIKDDYGYVGYESQVPEVQEHGTWKKKYNPEAVLKAFHDNDIYVIGRLVVYKDPVYSSKRPDLAIKNINGGLWKDNKKLTWLNPYNKENWDYTISIAREAVELGFDEIQFDYIRFPSDGRAKEMDFTGIEQERYEAICEFLAYAKEKIPEVPISADVFGIILESPKDTERIGQYLEYVGKDIDYISPMVYPSHYAYGQIVNKVKFDIPDLEPYAVVYNTLVKGKERIAAAGEYKAKVRPYLQDFTATWLKQNGKKMYQEYGAEQVRQQIQAVYDAGYEEWILWDASNKYHEDALLKEGEAKETAAQADQAEGNTAENN
jgi:hypothetical protein